MLQETSSSFAEFITLRRNELIDALSRAAEKICHERRKVKALRLFDSVARGEQVGAGDADIMIIRRGAELFDALEAVRMYLPYFNLPVGVDVLVFSKADIERRLRENVPFLRQIWQESIELCIGDESSC